MDLGLNNLNDDQLLELLQQACAELAQRNGYIRQMAQGIVTTQGEKLKMAKKAFQVAVSKARNEYIAELNADILDEVRALVITGKLRLFGSADEAALIPPAERAAHRTVLKEIQSKLKAPDAGAGFTISVARGGAELSFRSGNRNLSVPLPLSPGLSQSLSDAFAALLGEYPKWKYHPQKQSCIVNSREEELALGPGWVNSPAEIQNAASATQQAQAQQAQNAAGPQYAPGIALTAAEYQQYLKNKYFTP